MNAPDTISSSPIAVGSGVYEWMSLLGLAWFLISTIGLLFDTRWSQPVFLLFVPYVLIYEFVVNGASGSQLFVLLGRVYFVLAGVIVGIIIARWFFARESAGRSQV